MCMFPHDDFTCLHNVRIYIFLDCFWLLGWFSFPLRCIFLVDTVDCYITEIWYTWLIFHTFHFSLNFHLKLTLFQTVLYSWRIFCLGGSVFDKWSWNHSNLVETSLCSFRLLDLAYLPRVHTVLSKDKYCFQATFDNPSQFTRYACIHTEPNHFLLNLPYNLILMSNTIRIYHLQLSAYTLSSICSCYW